MRTREAIKAVIEAALRAEFPESMVSDGYQGNIHVLVVSRRFASMTEKKKQGLLWGIIDGAGLTDDEKRMISLVDTQTDHTE